jgi:hypothetical protein
MKAHWLILAPILLTNCGYTQYFKEVVVTKDGAGKIQSIVITERVVQAEEPGAPLNPEYIRVQNLRMGAVQTPTPTLLPQEEPKAPSP